MTDKKRRAKDAPRGGAKDRPANPAAPSRSEKGGKAPRPADFHRARRGTADAPVRPTFVTDHSDDAARLCASAAAPFGDISDMTLPELLLPAGSPDSLCAAIEAGADAVYFGASAFSARARAVNFTEQQIIDGLRLCRAFGVKAYAAVNTRIRDAELDEALALVGMLREAGADAIITADLGLCARIRETYPDAELHASTQLTPTSVSDALALADLGFARMVAPREITADALLRLCAESPIEIEAFIHGAHCVSLSGQCLMSSLIGARSANRGECAQPCRMTYRVGNTDGYLLSLADMCYAADIPAIISTGVRSLKIEGRQKDADYVCGVGKIYRKLLDERRSATEDEIASLAALFGRGFTDGYLRQSFGGMCGVRESDASREKSFAGLTRTVPLDVSLTLRAGEKPCLTVRTERAEASAVLEYEAKEAEGEPLGEDRARAAVSKLGATPFVLRDFAFDTDMKTWLSAAELNSLRRSATDKLLSPVYGRGRGAGNVVSELSGCRTVFAKANADGIGGASDGDNTVVPLRTAEFVSLSQIPDGAWDFFDVVYLPRDEYPAAISAGREASLTLPPYTTDADLEKLASLVHPGDRVLCHNVGQIAWVRSLGATADASFRLNVWNSRTLDELSSVCGTVTLSPELPLGAMRPMARSAPCGTVVYGKLPVMHTVRCMLCAGGCRGNGFGGGCGKLRDNAPCRAYLTDRVGAKFFILGGRDCTNTIYNSVPLWSADHGADFIGTSHFIFSDETAKRVGEVIAAYKCGASPDVSVRRLK